jgi:hypothetical protein
MGNARPITGLPKPTVVRLLLEAVCRAGLASEPSVAAPPGGIGNSEGLVLASACWTCAAPHRTARAPHAYHTIRSLTTVTTSKTLSRCLRRIVCASGLPTPRRICNAPHAAPELILWCHPLRVAVLCHLLRVAALPAQLPRRDLPVPGRCAGRSG